MKKNVEKEETRRVWKGKAEIAVGRDGKVKKNKKNGKRRKKNMERRNDDLRVEEDAVIGAGEKEK